MARMDTITSREREETNPFVEVGKRIDAVCHRLKIREGINARLKVCERELIVNFPVRMDDDSLVIFTGYREIATSLRSSQ